MNAYDSFQCDSSLDISCFLVSEPWNLWTTKIYIYVFRGIWHYYFDFFTGTQWDTVRVNDGEIVSIRGSGLIFRSKIFVDVVQVHKLNWNEIEISNGREMTADRSWSHVFAAVHRWHGRKKLYIHIHETEVSDSISSITKLFKSNVIICLRHCSFCTFRLSTLPWHCGADYSAFTHSSTHTKAHAYIIRTSFRYAFSWIRLVFIFLFERIY